MPIAASAASCSSTRAAELLVTKSTRCPAARNEAIASTDPGIGWWANQMTPSRSQSTTQGSSDCSPSCVLVEPSSITWPCWHAGWQPVRVPRFEPFAALRYSPDEPLDDVTAPPYDVLSTHRRAKPSCTVTNTTSSQSTCPWNATAPSVMRSPVGGCDSGSTVACWWAMRRHR